jgi:protein-S-isoprenylcysteine O-methyltransferase Ste14
MISFAASVPSVTSCKIGWAMEELKHRTIKSFVGLFIGLCILFFLPAGTIWYWQAWIFITVFLATGVVITYDLWYRDPALLERRLKAGPGAEGEQSQKVIMRFAYLAILALAIVPPLDHRFGWSRVPVWVVIAGNVLVVLGALMVMRVFRENSFTAATIQIADDQRVISTGPYAWVRHPMYTGSLIMMAGVPLALGSWWGMLAYLPLVLVIMFRSRYEEKFLVRNLPGYAEYQRKIKHRLLPHVW